MTAKEKKRVRWLLDRLAEEHGEAVCALHHETPFQLLAATILSAQCTDERVNMVTPELFRRWPTPDKLARSRTATVEKVIHSTGFYRNKAKSLQGMSRMLVEHHGGEVPRTMEELLKLPGVARKTANVVLGTSFGIAVGVVVDTHVARLSNRLGLTTHTDPKKIERELMDKVPTGEWVQFSHRLIWHGRKVCVARKPRCGQCVLAPKCPSAELPFSEKN